MHALLRPATGCTYTLVCSSRVRSLTLAADLCVPQQQSPSSREGCVQWRGVVFSACLVCEQTRKCISTLSYVEVRFPGAGCPNQPLEQWRCCCGEHCALFVTNTTTTTVCYRSQVVLLRMSVYYDILLRHSEKLQKIFVYDWCTVVHKLNPPVHTSIV